MSEKSKLTPSLIQYHKIKSEHKEYILFFRMGDFYEMFYQDALIASSLLGIVLTKKRVGKNNQGEIEEIPMCGIPFHSYENYLSRLIKRGYKVAICEQLETPEEAKKRGYKEIVSRGVVRIVTQGTLVEDSLIESGSNNYLSCIYAANKANYALATIDISTGDFFVNLVNKKELNSILYRLNPKEILISNKFDRNNIIEDFASCLTNVDYQRFTLQNALDYFKISFGKQQINTDNLSEEEKISCGVLISYLHLTHKTTINLSFPTTGSFNKSLKMDLFTVKSLELVKSYSGLSEGSLKHTLDCCVTSLGSRELNKWIVSPLNIKSEIIERQNVVSYFFENQEILSKIRDILKSFPDVERALARINLFKGSLNDVLIVKKSLNILSELRHFIVRNSLAKNSFFKKTFIFLDFFSELENFLEKSFLNSTQVNPDLTSIINKQLNPIFAKELAEKNSILNDISKLQSKYSIKLTVNNLKISYNNLVGYFFEIPKKSNIDTKLLEGFTHKGTTLNAIRYTNDSLIKLETKLLINSKRLKTLEDEILQNAFQQILLIKDKLQDTCKKIAEIDILSSFAFLAKHHNLVRPELTDSSDFVVTNGRHLVVEKSLRKKSNQEFISNSCNMENKNIFLITGPNMSGKSTYLRQNALIIIMAQLGSFIPADYAKIGICDAIFSRVGASDDLFKGQSTFMVEMLELAVILNNATEKSFIILDEIGRGTSTYDGISIAWATLEYLSKKIQSRTLFATHYHELSQLENHLDCLECYHVKVVEHNKSIIFMHKLEKGIINKSYGVEVGKLAGLPSSVIKRAKEVLKKLETNKTESDSLPLFDNVLIEKEDIAEEKDKILEKINSLDPNLLSPKEALDIIFDLKEIIKRD